MSLLARLQATLYTAPHSGQPSPKSPAVQQSRLLCGLLVVPELTVSVKIAANNCILKIKNLSESWCKIRGTAAGRWDVDVYDLELRFEFKRDA